MEKKNKRVLSLLLHMVGILFLSWSECVSYPTLEENQASDKSLSWASKGENCLYAFACDKINLKDDVAGYPPGNVFS